MLTSQNYIGICLGVALIAAAVLLLVLTQLHGYDWRYRWSWLKDAWSHWARAKSVPNLTPTSGWDCLRLTVAIWGPELTVSRDVLRYTATCEYELAWHDLGPVYSAEYSGRAYEYLALVGWRWFVGSTDTLP